jgi:hypothetical protein
MRPRREELGSTRTNCVDGSWSAGFAGSFGCWKAQARSYQDLAGPRPDTTQCFRSTLDVCQLSLLHEAVDRLPEK